MIIRIMRHGDAPTIDGVRQLSSKGIEESKLMGQWLSQQEPIDTVLVSPLLRAQQTAGCVYPFLQNEFQSSEEPLLKPEASARLAIEYFQALEAESVLLISHMPLVVNLLEAWIPHAGRYFPTASMAELSFKAAKPLLQNFITPAEIA